MSLHELTSAARLLGIDGDVEQIEAVESAATVRPLTEAERAAASRVPSPEVLQVAARLRIRLGAEARVVAVTGLGEEDGFTALAATLGAALATIDAGPVLLVDGNARQPRLHEVFGLSREPGLLEVLDQTSNLEKATARLELNNLFLLPAGTSTKSLASLLSGPSAPAVFDRIRQAYRYIVFDGGVLRSGPDAMLIAAHSDGVVVALARGFRRHHEVVQFRQELKQLSIPLCGVVLTQMAPQQTRR